MSARRDFRRGLTAAIAVATTALLGLAACGSSSDNASEPPAIGATSAGGSEPSAAAIKIGTIGQYSGYAGATSKATADSLQAWASAVNAAGGIHGHPVQVIVKDDAANASKSLADVKDLVENQHVVAIVGQHESGLEATWESYVDGKKIPVIGGPSVAPLWLTDPNFFPVSLTPVNSLTMSAYGAKLAGKTSIGITYCAELPACKQVVPLLQQVAQNLGLQFAGAPALSASATDYTSQCLALKSKDAGAVITATDSSTVVRFINACKQQGLNSLYINNPQNWSQDQLSNSAWDGVLFSSDAPLWFGDGTGTAEYLRAMKTYQPSSPLNSSGTGGWYAGKVFQTALDKAGITDAPVTSTDVYKGLYALGPNFDLDGVLAPVTYTEGKPAVQQTCGWFMKVVGDRETAPQGTKPVCLTGGQ